MQVHAYSIFVARVPLLHVVTTFYGHVCVGKMYSIPNLYIYSEFVFTISQNGCHPGASMLDRLRGSDRNFPEFFPHNSEPRFLSLGFRLSQGIDVISQDFEL